MNIESIFPGIKRNETTKSVPAKGVIARNPSGNNEAAKTLESGQKITGEVLSNDGSKLTLKLPGNMIINARMEQSVPAGIGDNVSFLVKSNDGGTVSLQPLMENMAGEGTAVKALMAAGININDKSLAMTLTMMEEGMSIGKNNLTGMYSKVLSHQNTEISNVVQMTKMGLPLDESNIEQFTDYKNFEGLIKDSFKDVLDLVPKAVESAFNESPETGLNMVRGLMELYAPGDSNIAFSDGLVSGEEAGLAENRYIENFQLEELSANENMVRGQIFEGKENVLKEALANSVLAEKLMNSLAGAEEGTVLNGLKGILEEGLGLKAGQLNADSIQPQNQRNVSQETNGELYNAAIDSEAISAEENLSINETNNLVTENADNMSSDLATYISDGGVEYPNGTGQLINIFNALGDKITALKLLNNEITDEELLHGLKDIVNKQGNNGSSQISDAIKNIFNNERFQSAFQKNILKQTELKPSQLSADNVNKLYEKLVENTRSLLDTMAKATQPDSPINKAVENIKDNLNFIDNLNQTYNFVQIPLKMNSANSEGELYVYTNKKSLANGEGKTSAYMHLDMEHLGVVNVYVKLNPGSKLTTNFYLEDEASLDLIEAHLPELTKRLSDKGYDVKTTANMSEEKKNIIDIIEEKETGSVALSHLAFDVRA